nr:T9SS type A sorting domain-containing protein [Empedobacter stercoris]
MIFYSFVYKIPSVFKNETEGIFDLTGKLIQVIQNQNTLTVQHLTPGNYIVKIDYLNATSETLKLIKNSYSSRAQMNGKTTNF